jgi:hypothetical protein
MCTELARGSGFFHILYVDQDADEFEARFGKPVALALAQAGLDLPLPSGMCGFLSLAVSRALLKLCVSTELSSEALATLLARLSCPTLLLPELIAVAFDVAASRMPGDGNWLSAIEISTILRSCGLPVAFLRNVQVGTELWQWTDAVEDFPSSERAFVLEEALFRDADPVAAFVELAGSGCLRASSSWVPPLGLPVICDVIGHFVVCLPFTFVAVTGERSNCVLVLDSSKDAGGDGLAAHVARLLRQMTAVSVCAESV